MVSLVRLLIGRRRWWQAASWISGGVAGALIVMILGGALDHALVLPRGVRIALLLFVVTGLVMSLTVAGWRLLRRRSLTADADEIQRRSGASDNALVTFVARVVETPALPAYLSGKLEAQAGRMLASIDPSRLAQRRPARIFSVVVIAGICVLLTFAFLAPRALANEFERMILGRADQTTGPGTAGGQHSFIKVDPTRPAIRQLGVRVVPPAYAGLPAAEFTGDQPVRALAGSRIELVLETAGPIEAASFRFGGLDQPLRSTGGGDFAGAFVAEKSGVLEVGLTAEGGTPLVRAVEVYTDAVPDVHLTEPAADLIWKSLPTHPIAVKWTAKDDLGLANLTLKYIKSRGAGDAATFVNGEFPAGSIQKASSTEWSGGSVIDLRRLQMEPGDTLVIWAEARDQRPGTDTVGRSGSISLALTAPELAKINLDGLGPTELQKFLLSERMILQNTERLHRERGRMVARDITRRANGIAADQREFRNSFGGFTTSEGMASSGQFELNAMGGPPSPGAIDQQVQEMVEERNEVHRHGIPDPPQGASDKIRDLVLALRAMGDAEDALADIDTTKAIEFMRVALTRLKSAQAAERYIPPISANSRPVDLKRRYAGELAEIKTRLETFARQPETGGNKELRLALTEAFAAITELRGRAPGGAGSIDRARAHVRAAAENLNRVTGERAVAVGAALGQLRIVEGALTNSSSSSAASDPNGLAETPFKLLLQATANIADLVQSRIPAAVGGSILSLPTGEGKAGEYFRLLRLHP